MVNCDVKGSYKGCCCCNCGYQVKIMKHPWNKGDAQGSMVQQMGYGCATPLDSRRGIIVFFDRQHGMCEMHLTKENR